MADPRVSPAALANAAINNATLAARLGWGTKGKYKNPADPVLVAEAADFQETETSQGRRLAVDGVIGPKTLAAIRASMARATAGGVAAGAAGAFFGVPAAAAGEAGADPWGAHWKQNLTIGAPTREEVNPPAEPAKSNPVLIIPDVPDVVVPPPVVEPASGGGMGGLLMLGAAAAAAWVLLG